MPTFYKCLVALFLFIGVSTGNVHAQQLPPVELGECEGYGIDGDQEIQKTMRAIRNENLPLAEIYAKNILEADPKNPHGLYLMGEIALRKRNPRATEAFFVQCLDVCPDYKAELQYIIGLFMINSEQAERKRKGQEWLELYLDNPMRHGGYDDEAEDLLEKSRIVERLTSNPVPFDPHVVRGVSTRADEYLAIISPDGELCFYTRRQMKKPRLGGPGDRAQLVEEFTLSTNTGNGFDEGVVLPEPFNSNVNEGAPTITANNRLLVFASCKMEGGYQNCDLFYTVKSGDSWSPIRSLGDNVNSPTSWESQPSLSANGDRLYFASNREGGQGGLDIYVTRRRPDGTWTDPKNLGPTINTSGNEKSPFIHSDSRTLYFASDGHPGMGGFDIFYAHQGDDLEYNEPINIGYPINKDSDQLGLFVNLAGTTAYFNSNELRGPGGWDLYSFELHQAARPEEVVLVRGTLRNEYDEPVTDADITVKNLATQQEQRIDVDNLTGEYAAVVKADEPTIVKVEMQGAAFSARVINSETPSEAGVVEADLEASELRIGREYRLNNINFATNSYELDNDAMLIIEEFGLFLEENPGVKVDIQGHTDNVGEGGDNLQLSKDRARVVYEYLIDWGISPSRMTNHGFGETKPVASNSTEEGRAKNRRTIFVITGL